MATQRQNIVAQIVTELKDIDGVSPYIGPDLVDHVYPTSIFWDEVDNFPTISVTSGTETREYLSGGFKWGFLTINIQIYVKSNTPKDDLENIFSDIESVLDANNNLGGLCTDIRILSLNDDEGLLHPLGVGEMTLQVQYSIIT
jgi:hypothetical protein